MPFPLHIVEVADGSNNLWSDRLIVGVQNGLASAAGGSAGAAVTVTVAFADLPAVYGVHVGINNADAATAVVSNKTSTGFTVTLAPAVATVTLAAGTIDVLVVA